MPYTEEDPPTAIAVPVNAPYQFQAANEPLLGQQEPIGQSSALHASSTTSTFEMNKKIILFTGICCVGTSFTAFAVCGFIFPGVMSFIGDIFGLLWTMLLAGFLIGCVLPSCLSGGENSRTIVISNCNPLLFALGALLYPLSFGIFVGAITVHVLKGKNAKNKACVGLVGFLLTVGAFAGGAYAVWDLFLNRYCLWEPVTFQSQMCSPGEVFNLPINMQLQQRLLQFNNHVIYDAYETKTNETSAVGIGNPLAVFGQSMLQRCSAPGAPWTYQDGQSVQMWNPENSSNPYSMKWVHSADRRIIWEIAKFLPYSVYDVFNCKNELEYVLHTETDFSTITMFTIKIHDNNNTLLASTNQQFTWTSRSYPFTKPTGEVVGTLTQNYDITTFPRDHWNINVKKKYKDLIKPYVYGHVASILKRTQNSNSRSSSSSSSSRRRRSIGSRRRRRL